VGSAAGATGVTREPRVTSLDATGTRSEFRLPKSPGFSGSGSRRGTWSRRIALNPICTLCAATRHAVPLLLHGPQRTITILLSARTLRNHRANLRPRSRCQLVGCARSHQAGPAIHDSQSMENHGWIESANFSAGSDFACAETWPGWLAVRRNSPQSRAFLAAGRRT
jgi:hypothetical protein